MNNPGTSKSSSSDNKLDRISNLLHDEGRPLTLNDLQIRIKDLSKKDMESSIKSLVDRNTIIMKTYGKQNIYFYNFQSSSDVNKLVCEEELWSFFIVIICFSLQMEESKSLNARILKYVQKVADKEKEIEEIEMKLSKLNETATIEELDMEFATLTKGIGALQAEFDELEEQDASTAVSLT